jgi:hypothetical protein
MKKIILLPVVILMLFFAHNVSAATLRIGMRGNPEVIQLQKNLKLLGVYAGMADGNFGSKTKSAVIQFQTSVKLSPDGVVGPGTQEVIKYRVSVAQPVTVNDINYPILCKDGLPHVQILYPNNSESYVASQDITVTWKTCNAPKDSKAGIMLCHRTSGGSQCRTFNEAIGTSNDGFEKIKILSKSDLAFFATGDVNGNADFSKNYRIQVVLYYGNNGENTSDTADEYFTISNK